MPYLNITEVESALAVAAAPPNAAFTQLLTLPHTTWEGRTCHALKIANGSGVGRIGVYFTGGVHAREWGSADILIFFIEQLAQAFRTSTGITLGSKAFTAAQIQNIVNGLDIFVFPQVNPDGRQQSMAADAMWRKNRRPAPPGSPGCLGVDINRNYDFLWNFPVYFNPASGVRNSTNPCDYQVYIGPGPFSEPETQNVVSILDNHPNIRFYIDLHSYGEDILYVWGDDQDQTTSPAMNFQNPAFNGQRGMAGDAYREYIDPCDQTIAGDLANSMQSAIQAVRGTSYTVEAAFGLYPTAGTGPDYASSRHIVDRSKSKVAGYTIEWGTEFQPPYAEMANIIHEVTAGLLQFCLDIIADHADVYIKDNTDDTGTVPYGGTFWNNSDIFVRQMDDNVTAYEPARQGQTNFVYVRLTNLGPDVTRMVKISLRAVRYPGTEFVYPFDWTTIDATHLEPTAIAATFNAVGPGDTRLAKFSFNPAQVDMLWGWQTGGWHPCLLAEVEGCNDYGTPVGVHVWENNNLAQRNISLAPMALDTDVVFPLLVGHPLNRSETVVLVIDRRELPQDAELYLDPFDRTPYFRDIKPMAPGRPSKAVLSQSGMEPVRYKERLVAAVRAPVATIKLPKKPGQLRQIVVQLPVPASTKPQDVYRVHVAQQDDQGQVVGGVTLEVPITGK